MNEHLQIRFSAVEFMSCYNTLPGPKNLNRNVAKITIGNTERQKFVILGFYSVLHICQMKASIDGVIGIFNVYHEMDMLD